MDTYKTNKDFGRIPTLVGELKPKLHISFKRHGKWKKLCWILSNVLTALSYKVNATCLL